MVALYYSQDKVGLQEQKDKVDIHSDNQAKFNLPSRVLAKGFVFKLMFGGSAFGYARDPDFAHVSTKEKYWQGVIDTFYEKYTGIAAWHKRIMLEARSTGTLITPSGRQYKFVPTKQRNEMKWPDTLIKNYVVQGFGADIVMLARIGIYRRLIEYRDEGILLINTVHDSIMVDCKEEHVEFVINTIKNVFADLDKTISRCYSIDYNIPMGIETEVGSTWYNLEVLT